MKKILLISFFMTSLLMTANCQWSQTNGPCGGIIRCLLESNGNLFAATDSGVFSSNNGGLWTPINLGLTDKTVYALASNGSTLYAGTKAGGLFVSTNNGGQWSSLPTGLTTGSINSILINGSDIFLGASAGVLVSNNNGLNWNHVLIKQITCLEFSGTDILAGGFGNSGGIYISSDNGTTWNTANLGLSSTPQIYCIKENGGDIFVGTFNGGIYYSNNGGGSWIPSNTGLSASSVKSFLFYNSNIYAGTEKGVFFSNNNGLSWSPANTGLTVCPVYSFANVGSNIFVGTVGPGIFISTNNGSTWSASNDGLSFLNIRALAKSGSSIFAGGTAYVYGCGALLTTDDGNSWIPVNDGLLGLTIQSIVVKGSEIFAATEYTGVFLSGNNGITWTAMNTGLTSTTINTIILHGNDLYVGTSDGIFISSNNGNSWTSLNSVIGVRAITFNGSDIYISNQTDVYVTSNNGGLWTSVNNGLNSSDIRTLECISGNVFAGTYANGVYRTSNNGLNWSSVNSGLSNLSACVLKSDGTTLFAGTGTGVYQSNNLGNTWQPVNSGLNIRVNSLLIDSSTIYAGTIDGVWASTYSTCMPITYQSNSGNPTVIAPSPATFTVSISGTSPSYQWQQLIPLGSWTNLSPGPDVTGVTSSTLVLSNTSTTQNNYQYRCIVSNSCPSSLTSPSQTLSVSQTCIPISGAITNGDQSVTAPASATFTVSVAGSSPSYQWQQLIPLGSWTNLSPGPDVTGVTSSTLILSNTSSSQNNYQYRCIVSNPCPSTDTSTQQILNVLSSPTYWIGFYTKVENNVALGWEKLITQGTSVMSSPPPAKICADGSKSTVINLTCNNTGIDMTKFHFRINGATDVDHFGQFLNSSASTLIMTVDTFQHPNIMDWAQINRPMILEIYNVDSPTVNIFTYPLEIYRAPVLFVHGLWGAKTTFQNMSSTFINGNMYPFYSPLVDGSPLLYRVDYENSNDNSFGYNSFVVPLGINKILYEARQQNFSAGKVDLVCHSMGGLLSRLYMEEIYGNQYRNDVHKYITLNTPHSGSQGANVLWNPIGSNLCHLVTKRFTGIWKCDDAIENMRVNSFDMLNLLNLGSNLNKMIGIPSYSIATDAIGINSITCNIIQYASLLSLSQLTVFNGEPNDLVVALSSQYGGITPNNLIANQCHLGSARNSDVTNSVISLINAMPNNSNFDLTGFTPPTLSSVYRLRKVENKNSVASNDSISIISPIYNSTFVPGGVLTCTINSTLNLDSIHFWASSGSFFYALDTVSNGTCSISFYVPDSLFGELLLEVFASDTGGNLLFDTSLVSLVPTVSIDSIKISPSHFFIATNEIVPINVNGFYSDGYNRTITFASGMILQVLDTNKAIVVGENTIQGKNIGNTYLIASFQGKLDTIPLEIYQGEPWLATSINEVGHSEDYYDSFYNDLYFHIFPNPTTGIVSLEIQGLYNQKVQVLVQDLLGNILFENFYLNVSDTFSQKLNLNDFASGIYIISVSDTNRKYIQKLIKE